MSLSLVLSLLSFLSLDPMKSAMFLVGALMFLLPVISHSLHVWYSYYICLLFLSGIFVVIVYFSSLSSFVVYEFGGGFIMIASMLSVYATMMGFEYLDYSSKSGLGVMVEDNYWFVYVWLVSILFMFLGFMSYFLSFEGALRKI